MTLWKRAMDYLGLGPEDPYDDYDAPEPEPPRQARQPRPQTPQPEPELSKTRGRNVAGYDDPPV